MKKILLSLGTLATVAAPIAAVVSCGNDDNKTTKPTAGADTNPGNNTPTTDAGAGNTGTGEQTPQAAISSASLAKIGAGILADGRILNNLLSKDSMDDFVNALINITRTVQKAAHETAVFEDSFVFDHATKTTVDKAAKVVRELLIELVSEIGGGDTIQTILKGAVKESAVANMLKEEKFTVGFATFIHDINLIGLLQNPILSAYLSKEKLNGFISGALPIKESTTDAPAAPVTMVLDAPGGSDSVPKFQQGTSKSLTLSFDLDSAGGMFRAGTVAAPAPATGSNPAAPATETIAKFDLVKDLLPLLEPKASRPTFSGSSDQSKEVIQSNLITFIGALMTELGSHNSIVGRFGTTQNADGDDVATYGHGLIDSVVEILEGLVPHAMDMNNHPIGALLSFSNGTPTLLKNKLLGDSWKTFGNMATGEQYTPASYTQTIVNGFTDINSTLDEAAIHAAIDGKTTVTAAELGFTEFADFARDNTSAVYTVEDYTGKSGDIVVHYTLSGAEVAATGNTGTFTITPKSDDYILGISGLVNIKAVNTNHGKDYTTSALELRSKVDNSLVATKAAGQTNIEFKTEALPVIKGTTMAGQAVTSITVAQLSHAMDIKKIFGVVNVLLGKVVTVSPLLQLGTVFFHNPGGMEHPAYPALPVKYDEATKLYKLFQPSQLIAAGMQAANVKLMETQFAVVLAGAPEFYAALTEDQRAQAINAVQQTSDGNPVTAEQGKRAAFVSYMNQLRHYDTKVTVNGKEESVANAMQTVLDTIKGFDATVWTQGQTVPIVKASMTLTDEQIATVHHAYEVIIEAANAGQLVLARLASAQFEATDDLQFIDNN